MQHLRKYFNHKNNRLALILLAFTLLLSQYSLFEHELSHTEEVVEHCDLCLAGHSGHQSILPSEFQLLEGAIFSTAISLFFLSVITISFDYLIPHSRAPPHA